MKNSAIAIYRMPNEKDFYSLTSEGKLSINSKEQKGFFFSDFENGTLYSLNNPVLKKNEWPVFKPFFNPQDEILTRESYLQKISRIIQEIKDEKLKKVVFSRIQNEPKQPSFNLQKTFDGLCREYPNAFVYCVSSSETGTWMGASPELLINKTKEIYQTVSLAGTRTKSTNWTNKEKEEQQVVTDYIVANISSFSNSIEVSQPYDLDTGAVIHLKSDINFTLNSDHDLWKLINNLHPTPAVCGMPSTKAKRLIEELEPHRRNLYTGFIGPMNLNAHASLFVNLRCMQIHKNSLALYVGGGIMGDSVAENEWIETENKGKTLKRVL